MPNDTIDLLSNDIALSPKSISSSDGVTFFRALAARMRDPKVRNPDYLAIHFLRNNLIKNILIMLLINRLLKRHMPGGLSWVNARTHHIDHLLTAAIDQGIEQLVILAAGNDSRPYRFKKQLSGTAVFEVDQPTIQAKKKQMLHQISGEIPDHVTFLPIDFSQGSLSEQLLRAGYTPDKKTFFIWEGCVNHLPERSINQVLEFIANHSAPQSSIVFDSVSIAFARGTSKEYGAKKWFKWFGRIKEPCLSGIQDDIMSSYIEKRGLRLVSLLDPQQLEQLYLIKQNGRRMGKCAGMFRIVHARVP